MMVFTNWDMWLLGWFIAIAVLGNLALIFSLFENTMRVSEKLIFITMSITIPLLMFFWVLNEIFKKIDSRKKKKREDVLSKFINKKNWVDAFLYLDNLKEGPDWIEEAFKNKELFYFGQDLIVKTSHGHIKVNYEDRILKYVDNTLGVMPKDLNQEVSANE